MECGSMDIVYDSVISEAWSPEIHIKYDTMQCPFRRCCISILASSQLTRIHGHSNILVVRMI